MNWLERARSEITKSTRQPTAVTAERHPTAVLAVPHPAISGNSRANVNAEGVADWWLERAAIMEFEGGVSRDEAERQAWARTLERFGLPAGYLLH